MHYGSKDQTKHDLFGCLLKLKGKIQLFICTESLHKLTSETCLCSH